jgi:hypothetical protein
MYKIKQVEEFCLLGYNAVQLYSIFKMIKSRKMGWAGHIARTWRREMHIEFWWESQKERGH